MQIALKRVLIVLINNQIQNYQRVCIIVLMYKVFFLMVVYITTQILQNVFGKVFLERLALQEISVQYYKAELINSF